MEFALKSPAFERGARIPVRHTCDGEDVSPRLEWTDPPALTRSLALVVDDPDAPVGNWVHWVVFDLPASARILPEGAPKDASLREPAGAIQGKNDFGRLGWGGPCPPPGKPHRYFFKL
ncbi:MAG: YbhB/YbcL family Raf kinase inhibitor-like protein, partial [Acidobacteriia bacterium]|nr:YbhB/YbcL family Raf kinase inhibitor-like protein [Terriglobia bacterium]